MKKIITLLLACFLLNALVNAQVSYTFSALQGTYTPVTNGTVPVLTVPDPNLDAPDEGYVNKVPIGFSFVYNGISYDSLNINVNGFITLGDGFVQDANQDYNDNDLKFGSSFQPSIRPIIAPFWDDLNLVSTDSISYLLTGSAPNRALTIQWASAHLNSAAFTPYISFQVILHETSNVIEFVYKREADDPTNPSASIGITSARRGTGNFLSLTDSTNTPLADSATQTLISGRPATGQVYRFTPLSCIAPSVTNISNVTASSATFSWNAVAGAGGYEYASNTTGILPVSGTATSLTTASITLITGANNYLYVRSNCGAGNFSAWSWRAIVMCGNNNLPLNNTIAALPVNISWHPVPGATEYDVMFSFDAGLTFQDLRTVPASDTVTTLTDNDLNYSTLYSYYIRPIIGTDTASLACQSNASAFTTIAAPAPINDSCGAAINITPGDSTINGTTISATPSPNNIICQGQLLKGPGNPDDDVWYKFTALNNGSASVTVHGIGQFDPVIAVYSGDCNIFSLVNCIDSSNAGGTEILNLNLQAGQTYYARVYDWAVNSPGNFTISVSGSALPVTMSELHGEIKGTKNVLTWSTQTEINNKGFVLLRSSDGNVFHAIDFVSSKALNGNSNTTLYYTYTDENSLPGKTYYRIKQTDKNGKAVISNIVLLKAPDLTKLQVTQLYPNPSKSFLNMMVLSPLKTKINLFITDLAGKNVMHKTIDAVIGNNKVNINVSNLSAGSYIIKITSEDGGGSVVNKFVKE